MKSGLIAVVGGIGSGKSVVCRILSTMGYDVYDCDSRAKQIMDFSDDIKSRIASEISGAVITTDGQIDRRLLASLVFADNQLLTALNSIVHTAVIKDLMAWKTGRDIAFVETAILYQSGLDRYVDEVWNVDAPMDIRVSRVCQRNGLTENEVMGRIVAQDNYISKQRHARVVEIVNDGFTPLLPRIEQLIDC